MRCLSPFAFSAPKGGVSDFILVISLSEDGRLAEGWSEDSTPVDGRLAEGSSEDGTPDEGKPAVLGGLACITGKLKSSGPFAERMRQRLRHDCFDTTRKLYINDRAPRQNSEVLYRGTECRRQKHGYSKMPLS